MTPLKFVTVSELKQKATAIVQEVERTKQQVVVTRNGKPVSVIIPAREVDFSYQDSSKKKPK